MSEINYTKELADYINETSIERTNKILVNEPWQPNERTELKKSPRFVTKSGKICYASPPPRKERPIILVHNPQDKRRIDKLLFLIEYKNVLMKAYREQAIYMDYTSKKNNLCVVNCIAKKIRKLFLKIGIPISIIKEWYETPSQYNANLNVDFQTTY